MNGLRQLVIPLVGFGVGWGGWGLLEKTDLVTPEHHQTLALWRLKAMRVASAAVPEGTLSMTAEEITERIELLQRAAEPQPDNRVKFVEVLQQCRVQEQLEWMEEHAEEEIPFFFIADLFHAFGALHEAELAVAVSAENATDNSGIPSSSSASASADRPLEDDRRFTSPILVRRTFEMMVNGVMPYDVASRVLGVLALKSAANRKQLLGLSARDGGGATDTIVHRWALYREEMVEKGTPEGDATVSAAQVDIATAQLLTALDAAATSAGHGALAALVFWKRRAPRRVWGEVPASDSSALADMCGVFAKATASSADGTAALPIGASARRVASEGSSFLKCPERLVAAAAERAASLAAAAAAAGATPQVPAAESPSPSA